MNVEHHSSIKQPDTTKNDCLVIYSPECITLKPREDTYLDLKFNVEFSATSHPSQAEQFSCLPTFSLNLSSTFKMLGLFIEESDWVSNRTKNNTIQLHLFNKSHYYTVKIKQNDVLRYLFLLGKSADCKIITQYRELKFIIYNNGNILNDLYLHLY